jgi:hypothetical protein
MGAWPYALWVCCCGDVAVKSVAVRASGTVDTPGRSIADIVKVGGGERWAVVVVVVEGKGTVTQV